jgi:hypothetical protein
MYCQEEEVNRLMPFIKGELIGSAFTCRQKQVAQWAGDLVFCDYDYGD